MSGTISANATVVGTPNGQGAYNYTITLNDTGNTVISTYWFAWVPGQDFMTQQPTLIGSPSQWSDFVNSNTFPGGTGYSIEWTANTVGADIPAGGSSSAFSFTSTETPLQMAADTPFVAGTPTTTSVVYQGTPLGSPSSQFVSNVALTEGATGTLSAVEVTPGVFNYTVTLTDTGDTPVHTFWFAWDDQPDQDFMTQQPTNVGAPIGWTDSVTTHLYPGGTGYGIEWFASSSSSNLNPGDKSSSFTFTSTETPAQFAAVSPFQINGSTFQTTSSFVYQGLALSTPGGNLVVQVACYREGTRIRTPDGDVPIEALRPGDAVVTAAGETRPIRWTGRRRVDCAAAASPARLWPIRVAAGALDPVTPSTDLYLSPDHALFLDGVLVPVKHLINGTTIARSPMDTVTWHHLELDSHDVILAEGAPAETWLDTGGGVAFEGHRDVVASPGAFPRAFPGAFPGDALLIREALSHMPLVVTGPALAAIRRRLDERALSLMPPIDRAA